nr:glycosyl hydrolase [Rhizobium setariae]
MHNPARSAGLIEQSGKIGIGTWDFDANGTAQEDLGRFNFGWYYNWQPSPLWSPTATGRLAADDSFVPMIWGADDVNRADLRSAKNSSSNYLLGFNEPDNHSQSDMTVAEALKLWPKLMATGKLLGSPATTQDETLGATSWLGKFMSKAEARGYDVDFVTVHYYSDDGNLGDFKNFLRDVYKEYHKPIWVTEWALIDWENPDRYSAREAAKFAEAATQMLDDLSFVKRHAWFGAYEGGDGWNVNTELLDSNGHMTAVGNTFVDLAI